MAILTPKQRSIVAAAEEALSASGHHWLAVSLDDLIQELELSSEREV